MSRVSSFIRYIHTLSQLRCFSDAPFNVRVKANSGLFVKEQPLTLNCSAEANPEPSQYKWYKDGQIMTGKTSQRLSFQNLDYDNNGTYKCTAMNSIGETQSSSFVIVVDGTFSLN